MRVGVGGMDEGRAGAVGDVQDVDGEGLVGEVEGGGGHGRLRYRAWSVGFVYK